MFNSSDEAHVQICRWVFDFYLVNWYWHKTKCDTQIVEQFFKWQGNWRTTALRYIDSLKGIIWKSMPKETMAPLTMNLKQRLEKVIWSWHAIQWVLYYFQTKIEAQNAVTHSFSLSHSAVPCIFHTFYSLIV